MKWGRMEVSIIIRTDSKMGQLNFFMTHDEILNEVKQLIDSDTFLLFDGACFNLETPFPMTELKEIENSKRLIIWIKNEIIQPKCSRKGAGDYCDKFLFDNYYDPIIEFDIEQIKDNLIPASRLFYKAGWINDNALRVYHRKQSNKIVRQFKKRLQTFERLKPFYISNGVIDLLDKGYEIELGDGGLRLNNKTYNCLC